MTKQPKKDEAPASTGRIEMVRLDDALAMAHPKNPKEHDLDGLVDSLARFGFVAPPTVDEATLTMVVGHGRCEALKRMKDAGAAPPERVVVGKDGAWWVPVIRGVAFHSERERDAYVVADNQHTIAGGWKFEALSEMLASFKETELGFDGLGFAQVELDSLFGNVEHDDPPDGVDPEDGDDSQEKPKTTIVATVTCPNCKHEFQR